MQAPLNSLNRTHASSQIRTKYVRQIKNQRSNRSCQADRPIFEHMSLAEIPGYRGYRLATKAPLKILNLHLGALAILTV
jgi:hypothetical protein